MKGSRQFRAALSELDQMMLWVREVLDQCSPSSPKTRKIELAVEEALVNVIHYAYPTLPGIVEVVYDKNSENLIFIIKDKGIEFNPLEGQEPFDRESPLEERNIGGLGIHFIKNTADSVNYQRVDGWNILTLMQKF